MDGYAQEIIELQHHLFNISDDLMDETKEYLGNHDFIRDPEKVKQIIINIALAVQFRPFKSSLYVDLISHLIDKSEESNFLSLIPNILLTLFCENVGGYLSYEENAWKLHFYHQCMTHGIFSASNLIELVDKQVPSSDSFHGIHFYFAFLCWFGPETQSHNIYLYARIYTAMKKSLTNSKHYFEHVCLQFTEFRDNEWELQRHSVHCLPPILKIIVNDDDEQLHNISSIDFDFDQQVSWSIFSWTQFLQKGTTLIQVAAFTQSIKCFKFLLMNGSRIKKLDNEMNNIMFYAIAGGNLEIIRICEQEFGSSHRLTLVETAITFHHQAVFEWLYELYFSSNLNIGQFLTVAAASNNIEAVLFLLNRHEHYKFSYWDWVSFIFLRIAFDFLV